MTNLLDLTCPACGAVFKRGGMPAPPTKAMVPARSLDGSLIPGHPDIPLHEDIKEGQQRRAYVVFGCGAKYLTDRSQDGALVLADRATECGQFSHVEFGSPKVSNG